MTPTPYPTPPTRAGVEMPIRVGYASIRHTQSAGVGAACFLPLVKSACYTIAHRNLMVSMSKQHAARRGPGRGGHNVTNYWEVGVWPLLCSMAPPLSTRPDGAPGDVGGAARVARWGGATDLYRLSTSAHSADRRGWPPWAVGEGQASVARRPQLGVGGTTC